jgi:hypothetical protein
LRIAFKNDEGQFIHLDKIISVIASCASN